MLTRLIEWEKSNGYKSKYVAEKLGIDQSKYSKIKLGKVKPSIEIAVKLQEEFDVNALELLHNE